MANINNLLSKIENYKTQTAEKAEQEHIAAETYRQSLYYKVWAMKPAIDNLITVAKAAQEAGISLKVGWMVDETYNNGDFFTDATTHKIGFVCARRTNEGIIGVGFEGGGCCGNYDFFTDGSTICDKDRDDGRETREASVEHLEKFIAKFARIAERNSLSKIWSEIISNLGAKVAKRFMKTCKCYAKAAMRGNRIAHQ